VALLALMLLPAAIAWLVAKRGTVPHGSRRLFVSTCTLLAYGVVMLVSALLLPLDVLATFVAPQLHDEGHEALARALGLAAELGTPVLGLLAGLSAAIWIPVRLQHRWAAVAVAIRAQNSPKPTPLRGEA